jgi:hypothetical protein
MADVEILVEQLRFLTQASETYSVNSDWTMDYNFNSDPVVLCNRLDSAIQRIALPGSPYIEQLEAARRLHQPYKLQETRAVALGLRDDMTAGWVKSTVELVHAETYSDYLEMADGLLNAGHKDAAAVITGTSLEVHVRALCAKHGIDTELSNGAPKKADVMNADLKRTSIYDGLQQKQITAWMDLRNKAAHGDYDSYDSQQVRLFIEGVRAFMLKYPA